MKDKSNMTDKNQKKKVLFTFAVYDHTGIKEYLERQASEGWMLEKLTELFMIFRRIEPKKLQFTVSYFAKASVFDPKPTQEQLRFQEFCEHTGWKHIASKGEMQVFCNEDEAAIPIETDPRIEVESIHKTMKKLFLPYYIYMIIVISIQVINFLIRFDMDSIRMLANNYALLSGFCSCLALTLTVIEFVSYYRWRRKALRYADEGVFIETSGKNNYQILVVVIMCIGLIFMIASIGGNSFVPYALGVVGCILLIAAVATFSVELMKRKGISQRINRIVTVLVVVTLTVGIGAIIFPMMFEAGIALSNKNAYTYEYKGTKFKMYKDEIPFRIEDFMDTGYDDYSTECTRNSSIIVDCIEASQRTRFDADEIHSMKYNVTKVKLPLLYDLLKKVHIKDVEEYYGVLDEGDDWYELRNVEAAEWEANEVYQIYIDKEAVNHYLLLFDENMVEIQFEDEWELTKEQKSIIGNKLKNIY